MYDDYAKTPPSVDEIQDKLIKLAEDKSLTPGQIWFKLTNWMRYAIGLQLAAQVAEKQVQILFPEFRSRT